MAVTAYESEKLRMREALNVGRRAANGGSLGGGAALRGQPAQARARASTRETLRNLSGTLMQGHLPRRCDEVSRLPRH